jgi:hypothetical protein
MVPLGIGIVTAKATHPHHSIAERIDADSLNTLVKEYGIRGALEKVDDQEAAATIKRALGEYITETELPGTGDINIDTDISEAKYTFTCAGCGCTTTCTPLE